MDLLKNKKVKQAAAWLTSSRCRKKPLNIVYEEQLRGKDLTIVCCCISSGNSNASDWERVREHHTGKGVSGSLKVEGRKHGHWFNQCSVF